MASSRSIIALALFVFLHVTSHQASGAGTVYLPCSSYPTFDHKDFKYIVQQDADGNARSKVDIRIPDGPDTHVKTESWGFVICFEEPVCVTSVWSNVEMERESLFCTRFFGPNNLKKKVGGRIQFVFLSNRFNSNTPLIPNYISFYGNSIGLKKVQSTPYDPYVYKYFCDYCHGGFHPAANCKKYHRCLTTGESVVRPCAPGTEFSPALNVCDFPDRAGCSKPAWRRHFCYETTGCESYQYHAYFAGCYSGQ